MGNLRSVARALEEAGAHVEVTGDPARMRAADGLCVPGQGAFGRCMASLDGAGLTDLIREWIGAGRPYLGICLGMQVLFDSSEEQGRAPGLGLFRGRAELLPDTVRVPHIGWNVVEDRHYYFDHSYAVRPLDAEDVRGWCEHGRRFAAWIERGPLTAVQFHPEKSARAGIDLLRSWLAT
jgi:glutamine amidotransferase